MSLLKELGLNLINIHGQHESYELFSPDTHITYIDNLANNQELLEEYKEKFSEYRKLKKELRDFLNSETDRERRIDILSYQVEELENADITEGETEALTEERRVLMNAEKTVASLHKAKSLLEGMGSDGALDILDDAVTALGKAVDMNPAVEPVFTRLNDLYYEARDINNDISEAIDDSEENPIRLEEIEERLDLLNKLSRKYGGTEAEMLEFLENARAELKTLTDFEANAEALSEKLCI